MTNATLDSAGAALYRYPSRAVNPLGDVKQVQDCHGCNQQPAAVSGMVLQEVLGLFWRADMEHVPLTPFSSLTYMEQMRVWALADATKTGSGLPLVRYIGSEAPSFYDVNLATFTDRPVLISEYWHLMQKNPALRRFVLL